MMGTKRGQALGVILILLAGCAGGGGDKSKNDDGGTSSGVTANFVAASSPSCSSSPDGLSLRKASVVGRVVTIGIQATDCNSSMGVFGINFEVSFDPSVARCAASNPCTAGTVLSSPLASPQPVCVCDNAAGHLLGSFSRTAPGGNQTVSGNEDVVRVALEVLQLGSGEVDFLNTGSAGGTALITLSGAPAPIGGLSYSGGEVLGQ